MEEKAPEFDFSTFHRSMVKAFMPDLDEFPPIDKSALMMPGQHPLQGVFGMFEMEVAAAKILRGLQEQKTWGRLSFVMDFTARDELVGLISLALHGWLRPAYPNGHFVVTKGFAKRVCR